MNNITIELTTIITHTQRQANDSVRLVATRRRRANTWYRNSLVTRKRSDSYYGIEWPPYLSPHLYMKLSKKKAPEPGVALGLAQYSFTFEISPLYASAIRGR